MRFTIISALAVTAVAADNYIVEPWGQCGGEWYRGAWECEKGTTCKPTANVAFPDYQCFPDGVTSGARAASWAQCGGQGYAGPTVCVPGWTCTFQNDWNSQCLQNTTYIQPVNRTPDLADPGALCGATAIPQGMPTVCVPGWTCSGPLTFGYFACLRDSATTTTVKTTLVTSTSSVKSTKSTAKATSTRKPY